MGDRLDCVGGYATGFLGTDAAYAYRPERDAWEPIARLPAPAGAHATAVFAGRIYVFGGLDGEGKLKRDSYAYDPASDSWAVLAPMPTAREHIAAAAIGGTHTWWAAGPGP